MSTPQEQAVSKRYSEAANSREPALCCPTNYDSRFLEAIPPEVVERDYGCGNPTEHLAQGETVLDLGSGGGKNCFIASQIVGETGRVIGVDMNDDMLALANRAAPIVSQRIGYANVEFLRGRIQDLKPLVDDASVDVVISNCALNLVNPAEKQQLFSEIFRVLKPHGRAIISDIVSDKPVPGHMQADPELWSGCISGALEQEAFVSAFRAAGFPQVRVLTRQEAPWQIVEGLEFRSLTVRADKSSQSQEGSCCG